MRGGIDSRGRIIAADPPGSTARRSECVTLAFRVVPRTSSGNDGSMNGVGADSSGDHRVRVSSTHWPISIVCRTVRSPDRPRRGLSQVDAGG